MSHHNYFIFSDETTLFRGNCLAIKIVEETMKLKGHAYLTETLKPLIDQVLGSKHSCEIDPSRLQPGESLEANQKKLEEHVELAVKCIIDSCCRCPTTMCEAFFALREVTVNNYPDQDYPIRHQVISGFVILRFFAPAILNPQSIQLITESRVSILHVVVFSFRFHSRRYFV